MTQNSINSANPIAQFVSTSITSVVSCTTVMPADNTIPQNTEGDEVITLSITPVSATSTLEIVFTAGSLLPVLAYNATIALFQDTTAGALAAKSIFPVQTNCTTGFMQHFMTSGTTSSTTFKIRVGPSAVGTIQVNALGAGTGVFNGTCSTFLTITEYL